MSAGAEQQKLFQKPLHDLDQDHELTPPGSSGSTVAPSEASQDSTSSIVVVDWDGPDDPEKPLNWSRTKKRAIISAVCLMRFTTYVLLLIED